MIDGCTKFVISHEDAAYAAFCERWHAATGELWDGLRVNITPETIAPAALAAMPAWWTETPERWTLVVAHRFCMTTARNRGTHALIFEQDCIFCDDFRERFHAIAQGIAATPQPWDMLYLGGWATEGVRGHGKTANGLFYRTYGVLLLHAYAVHRDALAAAMDWIDEPDWPHYHAVDDRMAAFQRDCETLVPVEGWLCGQQAGWSVLRNEERPERWHHFKTDYGVSENPTPYDGTIKQFVISCDDRRYDKFMKRVPDCLERRGFTRVNITPENTELDIPFWWCEPPRRYALLQAILTALKTAYRDGCDCLLMEDDCVFKPDFESRYKTFMDDLPTDEDHWDMAFLGGQLLATEFYPVMGVKENPHVLYAKNVHRNHAWVCHWATIPRLVEWLEEENWPCAQTIDSRIGYLQMQDDFRVYIPKAGWMCGQAAGKSSLVDIPFPERWWSFTEPDFTEEKKRWRHFCRLQKVYNLFRFLLKFFMRK